MGNIDSFDDEQAVGCLRKFHRKGSRNECFSCDAASICEYVCPANRISDESNFSLLCESTRLFLGHLEKMPSSRKSRLKECMERAKAETPVEFGLPWASDK